MKERLIDKKYPLRLIEDSIRRAMVLSREEIIERENSKNTDDTDDTFFVTTYNPLVVDSNKRIQNAVAGYNVGQPAD